MKGIPFRQISWGATIKLGLARSGSAGFVLLILLIIVGVSSGDLSPTELPLLLTFGWIISSIMVMVMGSLFLFFLSLFPMGGWAARIIGILLFCWGDSILYILSRVLGVFNYVDLKPINFVAFLYVLKEEEENEIGIRRRPDDVD